MAFDPSRLRFGDLIAAGGALLLFISLFLTWYDVELEGFGGIGGQADGGSGWDALGIGDVFLLLVVLAVLAIVVIRALGAAVNLPVPLSTVILALGGLATLYVLFRLIVDPIEVADALDDAIDIGRGIGIFLALLSSLAIAAGGLLSSRERGEAIGATAGPGAGAGGPLGGGPAGGPLAGGQQHVSEPLGGGQPAGGQPAAQTPTVADPAAGAGGATQVGGAGEAAGGSPKADWYPDPEGKARLRYWDGTQWTDQTAD